ncbi:Obg family GTPase CgtA, partial [Marinococcus halophilus]|uniref:Obg family GTPase CgtA n=1 Tax=Marinococcus halophilus TaxID=1371 RepID=UPI00360D7FFA
MANKMDMPGTDQQLEEFKKKLPEGIEVFPVSTLRKQGIQPLRKGRGPGGNDSCVSFIRRRGSGRKKWCTRSMKKKLRFYRAAAVPTTVLMYCTGPDIEKHYRMADLSHEDSMQRFSRKMRNMGVDEALRERGALHGDTVRLLILSLKFVDG